MLPGVNALSRGNKAKHYEDFRLLAYPPLVPVIKIYTNLRCVRHVREFNRHFSHCHLIHFFTAQKSYKNVLISNTVLIIVLISREIKSKYPRADFRLLLQTDLCILFGYNRESQQRKKIFMWLDTQL